MIYYNRPRRIYKYNIYINNNNTDTRGWASVHALLAVNAYNNKNNNSNNCMSYCCSLLFRDVRLRFRTIYVVMIYLRHRVLNDLI